MIHRYCVYGIGIASDSPLALPRYSHSALSSVQCLRAPASVFLEAIRNSVFDPQPDSWYRCGVLHDGSTYVRWDEVGEFLIAPDGRRIVCRRIEGSSLESFQVYMLGQALSFALVKQRFEPLHATAVVVKDHAVAFLGGSAFGKSTLAACFLDSGYRLLTDDLLMLQESARGVLAYPGPPRIKLFPGIARRFLGIAAGAEMNSGTAKLVLPLNEHLSSASPVPLRTIYSLAVPSEACRQQRVSIERLSPREAFMELVTGVFNKRLMSRKRIERQFEIMASLTDLVSVKKLVYPRAIDRLRDVQDAVLDDLARDVPITRPATGVARPAVIAANVAVGLLH